MIDDVGMLPVAAAAAEALFRVIDAAYEKRSIALTSNIHPADFDELMPKTLAAATVDRLLHHAAADACARAVHIEECSWQREKSGESRASATASSSRRRISPAQSRRQS